MAGHTDPSCRNSVFELETVDVSIGYGDVISTRVVIQLVQVRCAPMTTSVIFRLVYLLELTIVRTDLRYETRSSSDARRLQLDLEGTFHRHCLRFN